MKPVDFRNATFEGLKDGLQSMRLIAYNSWRIDGPGTTRQVATKSGMSILTLRPRTTELLEMGMLRLAEHQPSRTEGVYRVATRDEWEAFRAEKIGTQLEMAI